jgi:hypothetical protein
MEQNAIVCSKLSLERCRNHIAHIHAVMYMCDPQGTGLNPIASRSVKKIISMMDMELESSVDMLTIPESKSADL